MRVIFLKDVAKVGQRDSVKDVSDGYALNYLIPNGLAKQATAEAVTEHSKKKAMEAKVSAEKNAQLASEIKQLGGTRIMMKVRANEQGHLFKGIGKNDIAKTIGHTITGDMISDVAVIKEAGEYKIKVAAAGAAATLILTIEGEGR